MESAGCSSENIPWSGRGRYAGTVPTSRRAAAATTNTKTAGRQECARPIDTTNPELHPWLSTPLRSLRHTGVQPRVQHDTVDQLVPCACGGGIAATKAQHGPPATNPKPLTRGTSTSACLPSVEVWMDGWIGEATSNGRTDRYVHKHIIVLHRHTTLHDEGGNIQRHTIVMAVGTYLCTVFCTYDGSVSCTAGTHGQGVRVRGDEAVEDVLVHSSGYVWS